MDIKNKIVIGLLSKLKEEQTIAINGKFFEVLAMSFSRSTALDKLTGLQMVVSTHLFKLVFAKSEQNRRGWSKELEAWRKTLTSYNKPKTKQSNYSKTVLLKHLYVDPLGTLGDLEILKKQHKLDVEITKEDRNKLKKLTELFIDCILDNNDFRNAKPINTNTTI